MQFQMGVMGFGFGQKNTIGNGPGLVCGHSYLATKLQIGSTLLKELMDSQFSTTTVIPSI
jgi:hypothetical protein